MFDCLNVSLGAAPLFDFQNGILGSQLICRKNLLMLTSKFREINLPGSDPIIAPA
jgi:hypothetical protein